MRNYRKDAIDQAANKIGIRLDVLLVGATGVGKSSTLNALFGEMVAKQGEGVDPETMLVNKYELSPNLRFWDSPGLGDGKAADLAHSKKLIDTLWETYSLNNSSEKWGYIDLVMVILDASSRDLGTTYNLLERVILKNFQADRVLVCLNQADMAMKGRHWNSQRNAPDAELIAFLNEKVLSVQKRLKEATGLTIPKPVYYSATRRYHLNELLDFLIQHFPSEKRVLPR